MSLSNFTRASVVAAAVFLLPACGGGTTSPVLPTGANAGRATDAAVTPDRRHRQSPSPAASPTSIPSASPSSTPVSGSWLWAVTSDDLTVNTAQQIDALGSFFKRATVRTVFDMPSGGSPTAADYVSSVSMISKVADVMGLPNDSSTMATTSLATIKTRIAEYINALNQYVTIWCVGNEINGNWLGSGVMEKVQAEYDAAAATGKPTTITFYYENPPTPGYDMIPWIDANIPAGSSIRTGLNYALVSYYEDQNGGHQLTQPELNTIFSALAVRFPNAKVGFGEFGYGNKIPPQTPSGNAQRAALLQRFYGYRVPSVPAYVGAGFYWHFRQTMVPKTLPDWGVLNTLMQQ